MISLDKTLDDIMKLDFSAREMLLEILRNRVVEEKRKQIASEAKKTQSLYRKGKLKKLSASDTVKRLNSI